MSSNNLDVASANLADSRTTGITVIGSSKVTASTYYTMASSPKSLYLIVHIKLVNDPASTFATESWSRPDRKRSPMTKISCRACNTNVQWISFWLQTSCLFKFFKFKRGKLSSRQYYHLGLITTNV